MPIEVFVSYSREDRALRDKLEIHLSNLKRQDIIFSWYDEYIAPGAEWEPQIMEHLKSAQIILLLISADFIHSDFCYRIEMTQAIDRHNAREARVIPILLRPTDWQGTPFSKLEALPQDGKAVTSWPNIDEAFFDIVQGIRQAIYDLDEYSSGTREAEYSNRLYNTLVRLDYREQAKVFQQFKYEKHQIAAFFIHGAPSCGQSWLLNRLVKQLPDNSAARDFKFSFERKSLGISLKDLWSELAKWVGLKGLHFSTKEYCHQEIVKRVYGVWQRQTVFLILNRLHEIEQQYIDQFIQEFWLPLVEMTKGALSQSSKHYLLMFLVANEDCVDRWNITVAKQPNQTWEPYVPIKLEKLSSFSHEVLVDWIKSEIDTLPPTLTAQDILDNCPEGIPELVLDYVCSLFDYDLTKLVKYGI